MNTKDENLLVKVIKKAVGLPTGNSSCGCSAPAPVATDTRKPEAPAGAATDCDCDRAAHEDEKHEAETA